MAARSGRRVSRLPWCALLGWTVVALVGCGDETSDPLVGPVGPVGPVEQVDDAIVGSGEIVNESRKIGEASRLTLAGEGAADVIVGSGPTLTVETDANLLPYLDTTVDGDTLRISTIDATDIEPTESVAYRIEMVELSSIELAGAGTITVDGWSSPTAEVILGGVGEIAVDALTAESLVVERSGVGTIRITGTTDHQDINAGGVGSYDATGLEAKTAKIVADGNVEITVQVSESLEAEVGGSARLAYEGPRSSDVRTDDAGTITWLGDGR